MPRIVQIAHNATVAKLVQDDKEAKDLLKQLLSFVVEGKSFSDAFASGYWDGRSSLFSMIKRTFPAGFVHSAQQALSKAGFQVQLVRKPLPLPVGPENPIVDEFGNDDPRYGYQMETVRRLLKHGRMIAQVATGGGKSKIALLSTARISRPTLFLTTRSVLMHQMRRAYVNAGMKCGVLGDGEWNYVPGLNVGMVQTLVARCRMLTIEEEALKDVSRRAAAEEKDIETLKRSLKASGTKKSELISIINKRRRELEKARPSDAEIAERLTEKVETHNALAVEARALLENVEFVIGEEAHESGGESYYELMSFMPNAYYRLALTGTPFMRQDAEDNMRLMGAFGQIGIRVTERQLIDLGILAKPYFKYLDIKAPAGLLKSTPYQKAIDLGITNNHPRNVEIVRNVLKARKAGLPAMVLVTRTAHGKILDEMFRRVGLKSSFIKGENDNPERQRELNKLGKSEIDVLIGTNILDVGVDVPAVGLVVLAGGGKAEISLRQRIGRGLRSKKSGPNVCFILDFRDRTNSHLFDHARERRAIVEDTDGFAQNIMRDDQDLPWHLFNEGTVA